MDRRIALVVALSLFVSSCGGNGKPPASSSASVAGNWQINLVDAGDAKATISQSGSLLQNNETVSGSLLFSDSSCSGVGDVQGTITGSTVTLAVNPTGSEINLSGTMGAASSSACAGSVACMGGTYITLSTGCAAENTIPSSGTWTASLVSPLGGNITGTFTSSKGAAYSFTGKVSQGTNAGASSTPLSGSVAFGDGFCYSSANIVGSISGTAVIMNLMEADGTQIGQISGISSIDGSSVSGDYNNIGLGKGASSACAANGKGTTTLTVASS
ncbi:MAG: hypothetical protein WCC95_11400 [Candidatus Sulfotelmatobacter sp.]|jgi:hypothetical protein